MKRSKLAVVTAGMSLMLGASAAQADITFQAVYTDGAGEGFNDPALGAQRRTAFEFALNIWGQQFSNSYVGETIQVNAQFNPLGSGVLGQAGSANFYTDGSTVYGNSLANHLNGGDLSPGVEINATFSSNFTTGDGWYYGTDGNVGGLQWDFVTVVLHEVAHGLNIQSLILNTGAFNGGQPMIYDRFLEDLAGTNLDTMTNAGRAAAITSGNLFWNGAEGMEGNGGNRPELYAPNPFQAGSSVAHLDDVTHPGFLMNPGLFNGVAIHSPSAMELGMLFDMGWTPIPEPASLGLLGLAGLVLLRRRAA